MIEAASPSALSRKSKADEVLINVDGLTPRCFNEVNAYVWTCVYSNVLGGKGKKKRALAAAAPTAVEPSKLQKKK